MTSETSTRLVRSALIIGIVVFAAGCYIPAPMPTTTTVQPAPVQTVVTNTNYTPQYYNGYVVYFDTSGLPYYYLNGIVTYVPRTYYNYNYLVTSYRSCVVCYQRWYSNEGISLRSIRVNLGI